MAEKSGSGETPIELRRKIASTREELTRDVRGLGYELDFPLKFRKAFQRNTTVFIVAAVAIGLSLALLRARTRKIYVGPGVKRGRSRERTLLESSALLGLARLAITLAQPVITSYFAKQGAKKR